MSDKQRIEALFDDVGIIYSSNANEIELNDGYDVSIVILTFDEYGNYYETI